MSAFLCTEKYNTKKYKVKTANIFKVSPFIYRTTQMTVDNLDALGIRAFQAVYTVYSIKMRGIPQ